MKNLPVPKEETNLTNLIGPEQALAYAKRCSKALMDVVKQCNLAKNFGGKKDHIEFEGWGMIAEFYGCSIGSESAQPIGEPDVDGTHIGYTAKGYVKRNDDGATLATADSSCSRDEKNWKSKPDYQLMSMAQTRAGSKAARMKFSWIAALAGFSPTPAEEMVEVFSSDPPTPKPKAEPKKQGRSPKKQGDGDGNAIVPELNKFIQTDKDKYYKVIGQHGASSIEDILHFEPEAQQALLHDLGKEITIN